MAKRGCGCGCSATDRRTICAIEKYRVPSGSSITCLSRRSGVSKVECTFHSGQVPPNFENGNVPEENRLETLPALSTRSRKNGTPRAFGRAVERLIRHHHGGGEVIRQRNAVEPARRFVERTGAVDDGVDAGAAFGQPDLQCQLEGAPRAV